MENPDICINIQNAGLVYSHMPFMEPFDKLPRYASEAVSSWRCLNPKWEYVYHNDTDMEDFVVSCGGAAWLIVDVGTLAIVSIPITVAYRSKKNSIILPYEYEPVIVNTEAKPQTLYFELVENPEGMTIDESTGKITWIAYKRGSFDVTAEKIITTVCIVERLFRFGTLEIIPPQPSNYEQFI